MPGRLKTRREFLATATGRNAARPAFVVQARARGDEEPARFGFTVSKRTAKSAVERNRIRRRLKEAVRLVAETHARRGHDYVVIGRQKALSIAFDDLTSTLAGALKQVTPKETSAALPAHAAEGQKTDG